MRVRDRLLEIARERGLPGLAVLRVEAALRTLDGALGPLDSTWFDQEPTLAQRVAVPGDDATYIVVGEWLDGTCDVVREQGMFPQDCLVGWRPGQSLESYRHDLHSEPLPEIPPDGPRSTRPLRPDAQPTSSPRGRAPASRPG